MYSSGSPLHPQVSFDVFISSFLLCICTNVSLLINIGEYINADLAGLYFYARPLSRPEIYRVRDYLAAQGTLCFKTVIALHSNVHYIVGDPPVSNAPISPPTPSPIAAAFPSDWLIGIEAKNLFDTLNDMSVVTNWSGYPTQNMPVYHSHGALTYPGYELPYVSFNATQQQYLSFGMQNYNFYASGGFTFLSYMAFTGDPRVSGEVVFSMQISPVQRLDVGRNEASLLVVKLYDTSSGTVKKYEATKSGAVVRDKWYYVGLLYVSWSKKLVIFKSDSNPTEIDDIEIADGWVTSDTMSLAVDYFSGSGYLSANIAGLYLYDRPLLEETDISQVALELVRSSFFVPTSEPTGSPSAAPSASGRVFYLNQHIG